jgi:hypothetical protein
MKFTSQSHDIGYELMLCNRATRPYIIDWVETFDPSSDLTDDYIVAPS